MCKLNRDKIARVACRAPEEVEKTKRKGLRRRNRKGVTGKVTFISSAWSVLCKLAVIVRRVVWKPHPFSDCFSCLLVSRDFCGNVAELLAVGGFLTYKMATNYYTHFEISNVAVFPLQ